MATETYQTNGTISDGATDFMRKYRIAIYQHAIDANGVKYPNANATVQQFSQADTSDIILDVSDLHCVFDINRCAMYYPNTATVTIYNLTADTESALMYEGYRLQVYAGYEESSTDSNYGLIFDGDILMCSRQKTDGVDYTLTILAVDGGLLYTEGYANFTVNRGATARDVISAITKKSAVSVSTAHISNVVDSLQFSTSHAVHGLVKNELDDICKSLNATWYIDNGQLNIIQYAQDVSYLPNGSQAIVLDVAHGLLGNPAQVNYGVNAKCLLNCQIVPYGMISLPPQLITRQLVQVGTYSAGPGYVYDAIDPNGLYRVVSVNHHGDTRENDWYSAVSAISQSNAAIPSVLASFANSAN